MPASVHRRVVGRVGLGSGATTLTVAANDPLGNTLAFAVWVRPIR